MKSCNSNDVVRRFSVPDNTRKDEIARLEHLGPVVDSVIKISDDLDTIERLQNHMKVRERIHRDGKLVDLPMTFVLTR